MKDVTRLLVLSGPMVILPGNPGLALSIEGKFHANDCCVLWTRRQWSAYRAKMRRARPQALADVRVIEVSVSRS
jgi:hypothetical protein